MSKPTADIQLNPQKLLLLLTMNKVNGIPYQSTISILFLLLQLLHFVGRS